MKRVLIVRPNVSVSLPVAISFFVGALVCIASVIVWVASVRRGDEAMLLKMMLAIAGALVLLAPMPWALRDALPRFKRTAIVLVAGAVFFAAVALWHMR